MNFLEILGTIIGVLYFIFEYKANPLIWLAGIIMPAIYIIVYYNAGLYADFAINFYYLIIAVYGFFLWSIKGKKDKSGKTNLKISNISVRILAVSAFAFFLAFVAIGEVLINYTDSNVPWLDSFTTALSIIGMYLLAHKYIEQWFAWIAVDIVSSGLYIYKELYFTSALYAFYAIAAIFGYYKWKKLMADGL
ncbi:MAG: nicotinamide riboside transporter PnuC [Muribaculaceae bacterium]|nr:nicotinamide riboside transporter PnuC [Muribaculaceae bacterium]